MLAHAATSTLFAQTMLPPILTDAASSVFLPIPIVPLVLLPPHYASAVTFAAGSWMGRDHLRDIVPVAKFTQELAHEGASSAAHH